MQYGVEGVDRGVLRGMPAENAAEGDDVDLMIVGSMTTEVSVHGAVEVAADVPVDWVLNWVSREGETCGYPKVTELLLWGSGSDVTLVCASTSQHA